MLAVTDEAIGALNQMLNDVEKKDDQTLRLTTDQEGQYRFALDEQRDGDQVVTHGDEPLLLIADEVATSLDGVALEFVEAPEGGRLRLAPVA